MSRLERREPTAAPSFDVELGILIGAIFAFLILQAIPDLQAWARGEPPVSALESCRAEAAAQAALAARHAAVVVACLNAGHCKEGK